MFPLLLALVAEFGAIRSSSAKWAQTAQTVIVTVPLRRGNGGKVKCTGETASVQGERLIVSTQCGPDQYVLDVSLQHGISGEPMAKPNARRSEFVITLRKATDVEWSHLTSDPGRFKRLIERDFSRGGNAGNDDEEGDRPAALASSESGGQAVRVGARGHAGAAGSELEVETIRVLKEAQGQMTREGKVGKATTAKLMDLVDDDPDDFRTRAILGHALKARGGKQAPSATVSHTIPSLPVPSRPIPSHPVPSRPIPSHPHLSSASTSQLPSAIKHLRAAVRLKPEM